MAEYKINLPPAFGSTSMGGEEADSSATPWWAWLLAVIGIAGVTIGIMCVFLSMKDVMEVGGSCADGGPYVSRQPCPHGTSALILLGIFGGLISLAVAAWGLSRISSKAVTLVILAWGGLFGSLGYNFLYYAKNPPPNMSGTAGWWVCGVLFIAMALPGIIAPLFAFKGIQPSKRLPVATLLIIGILGGVFAGTALANRLREGKTTAVGKTVIIPAGTVPGQTVPATVVPAVPVQPSKPGSVTTAAAAAQLKAAAAQLKAAQEQLRQAQRQSQNQK